METCSPDARSSSVHSQVRISNIFADSSDSHKPSVVLIVWVSFTGK